MVMSCIPVDALLVGTESVTLGRSKLVRFEIAKFAKLAESMNAT